MIKANLEPRGEWDAGKTVDRAIRRADIIHARVPGTVTERMREFPFGREPTIGNLSFHVSTTEIKGQGKKYAIRLVTPLGHGQVPLINYELGSDNKISVDTEGWDLLEHDGKTGSSSLITNLLGETGTAPALEQEEAFDRFISSRTFDRPVIADWQAVYLLHRLKFVAKDVWPVGISLPDPDNFPAEVNNPTEHSDWAGQLFKTVVEKMEKTSSSQYSTWSDKDGRKELTTEIVRSTTGSSTHVRYSEGQNEPWHFKTGFRDEQRGEEGLRAMEQSARNILYRDFVTDARILPRRIVNLVR